MTNRSRGEDDRRGAYRGASSRGADGGSARAPRPSSSREPRDPGRRDAPGAEAPARKPWAPEGDLPRWIQEEVSRVTAKGRIQATLELLHSAAKSFAASKYGKALGDLEEAKVMAPRVATIRELMGLCAYRLGRWEQALRELRTFRRLTGETTHMPVEMDVLRALDRPRDVEEVWKAFRRIGGDREVEREARVVYASFLLDDGRDREAWEITNPKRIGDSPQPSELRVWFVAAKAAARLGDLKTARRLYMAIQASDAGFPALDELDRVTSGR